MSVPVNAQSLDRLKKRFKLAIAPTYDAKLIESGRQRAPSGLFQHVFDFKNGLRMIISRDKHLIGPEPVIHFSASISPDTPLEKDLSRFDDGKDGVRQAFLRISVESFRSISGSSAEIKLIGWSIGGIPHWYLLKGGQ